MSLLLLNLEELENTIVGYISNGAYMIYWNHRIDIFDYLLESDESSDTKSWIWRNIPRRGTYSVLERVELWISKECNCILWRLNSRISSAMHTLWSLKGGWLMRLPRHPISLGQRRNVTKYIVSCRPDIFVTKITWMRYTVNDFMGE